MHQRCIRSRQRREEYYTRELATDHEQYLAGPPSHGGRRPGRGCRGDTRQRGPYSWQPPGSHLAVERRSVAAMAQVTTRGNPGKELNSLWREEVGEG